MLGTIGLIRAPLGGQAHWQLRADSEGSTAAARRARLESVN